MKIQVNNSRTKSSVLEVLFRVLFFLMFAGGLSVHGQANTPPVAATTQPRPNIATSARGAAIIFSTPTRDGQAVNLLVVSGKQNKIAFADRHGFPVIMVLDLGQDYKVGTLKLRPQIKKASARIYLLKHPPRNDETWIDLILNENPTGTLAGPNGSTWLGDQIGRYLVIVFDSNPGVVSDLYVTGEPVLLPGLQAAPSDQGGFGGNAAGGIPGNGESPVPASQFKPAGIPGSPAVPPASN